MSTAELKQTPNQQMNIWVSEQIRAYESLASHSAGAHTAQAEAHVRGVIVGLRLLQDAWLRGMFSKSDS